MFSQVCVCSGGGGDVPSLWCQVPSPASGVTFFPSPVTGLVQSPVPWLAWRDTPVRRVGYPQTGQGVALTGQGVDLQDRVGG